MIEKLDLKGEWNIPGKPDSFNGIMTFDALTGSKLEIFGSFGSGKVEKSPQIVQGKTTAGWVTLLDAGYQSGQHSNVTSTRVSVYRPATILLGYRFNHLDEMRFSSVHFTIFNLLQWINIDGFHFEPDKKDHSLEYRKPADIKFDCYFGCQGKIEFTLDGHYLNGPYQMKLDQHCKVVFSYDQTKPFMEILNDIFAFLGFITFCTYEQSYPMEIVFFNEQFKDEFVTKSLKREILQPVTCIYQNSYYNPEYKKREAHQHLIKYESIAGAFNDIMKSWFTQSKELEPVIQLLLRAFINKNEFSTEKFMDVVRAIETFHRMKHNNEVISKEEMKLILDTIEGTDLSDSQKKFIKEKLNFAKEPTLNQRLEEMISLYALPYFDERVPSKSNFIIDVKNSRNYYTHYDKRLEKKALKGKELFNLTENMSLILFSAIFKSIGISEDAYDQALRHLIYST